MKNYKQTKPKKMDTEINLSCFEDLPQDFLVCLTIHRAKDLAILDADTYVRVHIDNKSKTTATFKKSDQPYFNEYFVFEFYCGMKELLRKHLTLILCKRSHLCSRDNYIGEVVIDLNSVWNMKSNLPIYLKNSENFFLIFLS